MASSAPLRPHLVVADARGNIYDHPDLLMICRRGTQWGLPRPDELMPLPAESELFLLPGRRAVGLDPQTGVSEVQEEPAVAAFAAPAHTLTAHPAYVSDADAPVLPLFASGAVGFARGRFYVCARKVDEDVRQVFRNVSRRRLEQCVRALVRQYPENRLMQHIMNNCVLRYDCPAARNLALGRYEAPLPTSHVCNARCVGCISQQEEDSLIRTTPQCRLEFTPTPREV
ncbi:MAG: radical SAM protein, partial [Desulfovibrionaceae bacterium]|nr:radical SAM protein [Desulfovibrionaceae bacterium]